MSNLKKKVKLYLSLIIGLSLLILFFAIMLFININDGILSLLYGIGFFGFFIILFLVKNNYDYNMNLYRYQELLDNALEPISLSYNVSQAKVMEKLKEHDYKVYTKGDNFISFYKLDKGIIDHKRHRTLYIAVILINNKKEFSDPINNDYFEAIEKHLYKKEKYFQRVFHQIKFVSEYNNKNISDTNKIFFINAKREYIVIQNLLFNTNNNSLYYLHSNEKAPNKYFVHSDNLIDEMFIK
ncbi:MAG TPA: hypothetical protein GX003_02930 [Acholeplasmataceae bacterium]|mgnify:CR=1 FL=1|jgi:hypothetical protein|nr:hypothetical protein [Acholeplasmataceae bacterium]